MTGNVSDAYSPCNGWKKCKPFTLVVIFHIYKMIQEKQITFFSQKVPYCVQTFSEKKFLFG